MTLTTFSARAAAPAPPLAKASESAKAAPWASQYFSRNVQLFVGVFGEAVDGDDGRKVEAAHDGDVFFQIFEARFEVALALVADGLDRGDEDCGGGFDAGGRHHDVHVFFKAEVGGEAGLVDDVVGEAEAHLLRDDGAGAVGDVGEGAAVDERGRAFGGLDEIGQDGFGEQGHHGTGGVEVCGEDGLAGAGLPMTMRARRLRRSSRLSASVMMAMISLAAVMRKPV